MSHFSLFFLRLKVLSFLVLYFLWDFVHQEVKHQINQQVEGIAFRSELASNVKVSDLTVKG